jgi:hypothetical protein
VVVQQVVPPEIPEGPQPGPPVVGLVVQPLVVEVTGDQADEEVGRGAPRPGRSPRQQPVARRDGRAHPQACEEAVRRPRVFVVRQVGGVDEPPARLRPRVVVKDEAVQGVLDQPPAEEARHEQQ